MADEAPRSASERALYDKILAEIKAEGVIAERNWEQVAQRRFELRRIWQLRHEQTKPLRDDLRACGVEVESTWNLSEDHFKVPGVLDVLLKHLNGDYDDATINGIVGAIHRMGDYGEKKADVTRIMMETFAAIEGESHAKNAIGLVLAETTENSELGTLLDILADKSHRVARWGIVTAVAKLMKADAVPLLIDLLEDETVRVSAIENLGRLKAAEAIPHIEPFAKDKDSYVRQIAKKAIRQCQPKAHRRSRLPPPSPLESIGDRRYESRSTSIWKTWARACAS